MILMASFQTYDSIYQIQNVNFLLRLQKNSFKFVKSKKTEEIVNL